MRIILIFVIFFRIVISGSSQNYFSHSYQFNNESSSDGANIFYKDDSFLVNLIYANNDIAKDSLMQLLFSLDVDNPNEYTHKLVDPGFPAFRFRYHKTMALDSKGNIYIAGAGDINSLQKSVLLRVRSNRTFDWSIDVGNMNGFYCGNPIVINDNLIVYVNYFGEFSKFSNNELVWIDSMGNELKKVQMPQKDYIYNENPDVRLMPDSGFVLATHSYIYKNGFSALPRYRIIRMDKEGVILWDKEFGIETTHGSSAPLTCPFPDGNILGASQIQADYYDSLGNEISDPLRLFLIGKDGQVLKTKDISEFVLNSTYFTPFNGFNTSNGDVVLMGQGNYGWLGSAIPATIARVGSDLEYKWMRVYKDTTICDHESYLYDGTELPNGDLAFCGSVRVDVPPGTNSLNGIHLWILKVDSMGCVVPGCTDTFIKSLTKIDDVPKPQKVSYMTFYPNPVKDKLNVLIKFGSPRSRLKIMINDILGKTVLLRDVNHSEVPQELDVSGLVNGVYLLQLFDRFRLVQSESVIVTK